MSIIWSDTILSGIHYDYVVSVCKLVCPCVLVFSCLWRNSPNDIHYNSLKAKSMSWAGIFILFEHYISLVSTWVIIFIAEMYNKASKD